MDEAMVADFKAEVDMLGSLRHPNICLFMGACLSPPHRAIVTELVSRGSLWEALRRGALPTSVVAAPSPRHSSSSAAVGATAAAGAAAVVQTPAHCWPWLVSHVREDYAYTTSILRVRCAASA
jgi:Protein tyrosine and serine/threonine kinase